MFVTHRRIIKLQDQLYRARPTFETMRTLGDLLERANNSYRRQLLALAEYRAPRATATFIRNQLNQANQQVIQNQTSGEEKPENESIRQRRYIPCASTACQRQRGNDAHSKHDASNRGCTQPGRKRRRARRAAQ